MTVVNLLLATGLVSLLAASFHLGRLYERHLAKEKT